MAEDASNAATPIAAKMAFGFVLMSNLTALGFSSSAFGLSRRGLMSPPALLLVLCGQNSNTSFVDSNDERAIFGGGDARN